MCINLLCWISTENLKSISSRFQVDDYDGPENSRRHSDLCDGKIYMQSKRDIGSDSIALLLNADGAPVFKSSKYSVWPLTCAVAELPPKTRYRTETTNGFNPFPSSIICVFEGLVQIV